MCRSGSHYLVLVRKHGQPAQSQDSSRPHLYSADILLILRSSDPIRMIPFQTASNYEHSLSVRRATGARSAQTLLCARMARSASPSAEIRRTSGIQRRDCRFFSCAPFPPFRAPPSDACAPTAQQLLGRTSTRSFGQIGADVARLPRPCRPARCRVFRHPQLSPLS